MGTCSYVLTGTEQGMQETFGSTCHGAVSILSCRKESVWDDLDRNNNSNILKMPFYFKNLSCLSLLFYFYMTYRNTLGRLLQFYHHGTKNTWDILDHEIIILKISLISGSCIV